MKSGKIENLWGLREETHSTFTKIFTLCSCLRRSPKVGDVGDNIRTDTPVLESSITFEDEPKPRHRDSSGSESSGYFTPPPAETTSPDRQSGAAIQAVTPIPSPAVLEVQPIEDIAEKPQEEVVEYIEVINQGVGDNNNKKEETTQKQELNANSVGVDEVDRKIPSPSISEYNFDIRPISENRKSKSEVNLERTLPIIVDRKNLNSAPIVKDLVNNNITEQLEDNPTTHHHICNNTNINITIPLPGSLIQEEVDNIQTPPVLIRKLSKRFSQVPIRKKVETNSATQKAAKPKTDPTQDVLDQMSSQEWETVMVGLKNLGKLAKSNQEMLEPHMHAVCIALASHIKNLRSQVARAACQSSREMFLTCSQKGLEGELEELAGPLLHRTADTNKFLREDANAALDTMIEKVHPAKAVIVLTTRGTTHQNAIVRGAAVRLLERLVKTHGTDKMFSLGKEVRDRLVLAGANALTEGSLDTRKQAKTLLKHMITHQNFQKALLEAVPPHTMRHIAKTLNSLKMSQ